MYSMYFVWTVLSTPSSQMGLAEVIDVVDDVISHVTSHVTDDVISHVTSQVARHETADVISYWMVQPDGCHASLSFIVECSMCFPCFIDLRLLPKINHMP